MKLAAKRNSNRNTLTLSQSSDLNAGGRTSSRNSIRKVADPNSYTGGPLKTDPLFVIFEQHLFHFQDSDSDRKTFIFNIIRDYFGFLRKRNITIPKSLEPAIVEELGHQVNSMLTKKIYGCLNITDFQKGSTNANRRKAQDRYTKLVK